MPKPTRWACLICGHEYHTRQDATLCEKLSIYGEDPYNIGDEFVRLVDPNERFRIVAKGTVRHVDRHGTRRHIRQYVLESNKQERTTAAASSIHSFTIPVDEFNPNWREEGWRLIKSRYLRAERSADRKHVTVQTSHHPWRVGDRKSLTLRASTQMSKWSTELLRAEMIGPISADEVGPEITRQIRSRSESRSRKEESDDTRRGAGQRPQGGRR